MTTKNKLFVQKIHLIISVVIVMPVAFIYGFDPGSQFNIELNTVDEQNQFKAIMGLYIGFSVLWISGIIRTKYLRLALITNLIFMLGLGFGRLLSLFIDGVPTFGYQFGTFAELFLGFYGLWVLNSKYFKKP
ncbi:DUF4345 domain-containing protein [uncultured Winogradskyella sp.]|uniref:DUF4345 domain-containing protein n=1 Tax=uncultured Winogradskyella sp. TaxID=395353 RepID=UPI0026069885|nr:DUF4345 domain-containing protein [uncultured Winogradskyella sp.]